MMQDLILWTYLTPLVGATPEVQVHISRAHHSVLALVFAVTMPTSLPHKNLPAFDNKYAPKLAERRISSEMIVKSCLPEIKSCNYVSVKDENLRLKSSSF